MVVVVAEGQHADICGLLHRWPDRREARRAVKLDILAERVGDETAIAADRIFARRLSITASIGVLFKTYNAGKLLETIGIGSDKIASGPLKAEPDIDHPMSADVRASIQSLVDDSFAWFVDIVAERRGLSREATLALADGRIMTGNQAIASKLVDEVGAEQEAIAWLEKNKGLKANLPVVTWYPNAEPDWRNVARWAGGQARARRGRPRCRSG